MSAQVVLRAIAVEERDALYEMARRFWEELMPHAPVVQDPSIRSRYFAHEFPHCSLYRIDLHARSDAPASLAFWRAVGYDLASYRMRRYLD